MKTFMKPLRSPLAISVLASLLIFLVISAIRDAGWLESLELSAYDWYIRLQPKASSMDSRIVLIGITEKDIRNQGRWPVTDATLAQMLTILIESRPRAIGLDIYRDVSIPPGTTELNEIFRENHRIVTAMRFGDGDADAVPPPSALENTDQFGFNDILVDPGGLVRRGLLFIGDGKTTHYAFALRLALRYLEEEGIIPQPDPRDPEHMRLGRTTLRPLRPNDGGYCNADTRGYQFLIDFKDDLHAFTTYPLSSLLSGGVDPRFIEGRIVIVGITAKTVKDFFYTPQSRGLGADQQISGIALHGFMASQLIRHALEGYAPIRSPREHLEMFWILLWSVAGGMVGLRCRSPIRFSLLAASGLFVLFLCTYFALVIGWWGPVVSAAMTWLISFAVVIAYMSSQEKEQKAMLMELFSRHVSKDVAETVWQQRDRLLGGGRPIPQKSTVTVMFTDMKGFTQVSEKMAPEGLIEWLNTYMETMAQIVMAHGGMIDDYIGDGLKANFGIPLICTDEAAIGRDAVNAVNCALEMKREMRRLNAHWEEHGLPTSAIRIGIFTGPVVVGSVGSTKRLKYTTLGDTVNIAARLESYEKDLFEPDTDNFCRILIGESTRRYLDSQFKTEKVGGVLLKGKEHSITVYRVIDRLGTQSQRLNQGETK